MSWFLSIDTATDVGSVAVGPPGGIISEVLVTDRRHAAALIPAVGEALRLAGIDYPELEGAVVADGPGSFTGLRIGFATVLGILRQHEGLALRTAPSLLAAAWGAHHFVTGPVAALYDALRGDVFAAVYHFSRAGSRRPGAEGGGSGGVEVLIPPQLTSVSDLAGRCPVIPTIAVGDGATRYHQAVRDWTGREPVGPLAGAPRAGALLELLAIEGATSSVDDPIAFEPSYGRPAEAQARWEREHGRPLPHSVSDLG